MCDDIQINIKGWINNINTPIPLNTIDVSIINEFENDFKFINFVIQ